MPRSILVPVVLTLCLSGCLHWQGLPEQPRQFQSPDGEFALSWHPHHLRLPVTQEFHRAPHAGSLTFWDRQNRFFQIDYFELAKSPLADVPEYASDRTVMRWVMKKYLSTVIRCSDRYQNISVVDKRYVPLFDEEGYFMLIRADLPPEQHEPIESVYQGLLIFKKGLHAYLLQHRSPTRAPDTMLTRLRRLSGLMTFPSYHQSTAIAPRTTEKRLTRSR